MLSLLQPTTEHDDPPAQRAADLLDAMGLTTTLPTALIEDADGRAFEAAQLNVRGDLAGQFALLIRPEPLGGAEQQIHENGRRIEALACVRICAVR